MKVCKVSSWNYDKLQGVINDWWKTGEVFFTVYKTSEDEMKFIKSSKNQSNCCIVCRNYVVMNLMPETRPMENDT